jgi:hypothetical protein
MKTFVKASLVAAMLFATVSGTEAQVSIGVTIGPPPPPRVVRVVERPPDPDFIWVEGYWYPVAGHYVWHDGYWTRPPYEGARWVSPRHDGRQFFAGYWEGNRGRVEHDHHSTETMTAIRIGITTEVTATSEVMTRTKKPKV